MTTMTCTMSRKGLTNLAIKCTFYVTIFLSSFQQSTLVSGMVKSTKAEISLHIRRSIRASASTCFDAPCNSSPVGRRDGTGRQESYLCQHDCKMWIDPVVPDHEPCARGSGHVRALWFCAPPWILCSG